MVVENQHNTGADGDDLSSQETSPDLVKRYQHDEFCKDNLRDLDKARKFLKWLFGRFKPNVVDLLDLENLELSSESFLDPELKKLYADVLYRIPVKDGDASIVVFVLVELKTESDKWTVFQQVKYIVRIWDAEHRKAAKAKRLSQFRLPMVIPVIFHHAEQEFTASTELIDQVQTLEGMEPYTLNVKSLLCDITPLDESEFPDDLELNVMFMALQAVFREDVAERLMRIYRKLHPNLSDPIYRRQWEDCLFYAITSAKYFTLPKCEEIITEIRNTGDVTMSTADFVSVADQLEARGRLKEKINDILGALRIRHKQVPDSIVDELKGRTDLIALQSLFEVAVQCNSIDEFAEALK